MKPSQASRAVAVAIATLPEINASVPLTDKIAETTEAVLQAHIERFFVELEAEMKAKKAARAAIKG